MGHLRNSCGVCGRGIRIVVAKSRLVDNSIRRKGSNMTR
jgi:hypothetical protein